jgi:hypothetical protein
LFVLTTKGKEEKTMRIKAFKVTDSDGVIVAIFDNYNKEDAIRCTNAMDGRKMFQCDIEIIKTTNDSLYYSTTATHK